MTANERIGNPWFVGGLGAIELDLCTRSILDAQLASKQTHVDSAEQLR